MKIAIPQSKRELVIECCESAFMHEMMEPHLIDIIESLKNIFEIDSDSPFKTETVYVVDEEDFDLMLSFSDIPYSTEGDMDVIDEELKNKVHKERCRSF